VEKGHKVYLANYKVTLDGNEIDYNVRNSLVAVLFHEHLELNSLATRRNDKIATKIEDCVGDYLTLIEEDYGVLLNAVTTFIGFDRNAVKLISRVEEAEEVEIEIKEAESA